MLRLQATVFDPDGERSEDGPMMPWRRYIEPLARPFFEVYWRLSRGATLGVRGLVLNDAGEILLVEHTYMSGWFLPGGGVEHDETTEAALIRELREEGGVEVIGRPVLLGIHANHKVFRGDHVVLYRVDTWSPCDATAHQEILARGWFAPDRLPPDLTEPTRRRIEEALGGAERSLDW